MAYVKWLIYNTYFFVKHSYSYMRNEKAPFNEWIRAYKKFMKLSFDDIRGQK